MIYIKIFLFNLLTNNNICYIADLIKLSIEEEGDEFIKIIT